MDMKPEILLKYYTDAIKYSVVKGETLDFLPYTNKEITKLFVMLVKANIECELTMLPDKSVGICSPNNENSIVDAVSHKYSRGGKCGLIEVWGSLNSKEPNHHVVGWLTAEEAFKYFKKRDYVPKH